MSEKVQYRFCRMNWKSTYSKWIASVKTSSLYDRFFVVHDERTTKARKNILYSFFFKATGTLLSLLLVPLTLKYLNPTKYGIWLTLSAIISWIGIFDIGLGNGLRNKLGEALAIGDIQSARTYLSTTYAILGMIVTILFILFGIAHNFIDWAVLLNVDSQITQELRLLAFLLVTFFLIRLISGLIIQVLTADQKLEAVGLMEFLINLFSLVVVLILPYFISNSLLWVGASIGLLNCLIPGIATFYFFRTRYKAYSPSSQYVNFKFIGSLMNLSFDFFLLSISTIIIYFSQNLIISHLFSPSEVSTFNIAYKYFFFVVIIQVLILNAFLPAATEAFFKGELQWIRTVLKRLIYIWIFIALGVVLMILLSDYVYKLWVGQQIKVDFPISIAMGIYIILFTWYATFAYIINGIGKIKLQLYVVLTSSFLIVPLSIFLVQQLDFGIEGVIFAGSICTIPGSIIIPIQLYKILNNKARGVWNK